MASGQRPTRGAYRLRTVAGAEHGVCAMRGAQDDSADRMRHPQGVTRLHTPSRPAAAGPRPLVGRTLPSADPARPVRYRGTSPSLDPRCDGAGAAVSDDATGLTQRELLMEVRNDIRGLGATSTRSPAIGPTRSSAGHPCSGWPTRSPSTRPPLDPGPPGGIPARDANPAGGGCRGAGHGAASRLVDFRFEDVIITSSAAVTPRASRSSS
jgi:hypothetical protein